MNAALVPADLARIVTAADVQISADARTVIYRRDGFDLAANRRQTAIHMLRAGNDIPLTTGTSDALPRLRADGTQLAYVSHDTTGAQLHVRALESIAAITFGPRFARITAAAWSPDGARIAIAAAVPTDDAATYRDVSSGALHARRLPYKRDDDGLLDGTVIELWVIACAEGTARRLTHGTADVRDPAWSPNGSTIAFARRSDTDETSTCAAIFTADLVTAAIRQHTGGDGAADTPVFSPDGTQIAFVGHRHGSDYRYSPELLLYDCVSGTTRSLSATLDRPIGNFLCGDLRSGAPITPVWRPDGRAVLAAVTESGACVVRAFDVIPAGRSRVVAGGERDIAGVACAADGTLAIAYSTSLEPSAVALIAPLGYETRITTLNPWLAQKQLRAPQRLRPRSAEGVALDAWFVPAARRATPQPLVIDLHPGPHACAGATFSFQTQVLAGAGIGVVYGNPRGSQGYGQAFALAITGRWGELDCADVFSMLAAADAAGGSEATCVACMGQSYGGFLTTWLLGHHAGRFAAGVSLDAVNELAALAATSDVGATIAAEFGVDDGVDPARALFERSPLRAAAQIVAPLLIVHSERDYRCPIDQGEALFNTLRAYGRRNVEFVRLTGDGHELSRSGAPRGRILRMRAIVRWLLAHLCGDASAAGGPAGILFHALPDEATLDPAPARV